MKDKLYFCKPKVNTYTSSFPNVDKELNVITYTNTYIYLKLFLYATSEHLYEFRTAANLYFIIFFIIVLIVSNYAI